MKLKLPPLFPAKKKKLRVGAARRATVPASDFDDLSEPNMKLSRALLIVLLLHVVAVAGIIAFNAIKSRQDNFPRVVSAPSRAPIPQASVTVAPKREEPHRPPLAKTEKKPKGAEPSVLPDGAKYYTVAKGDSPVTIAKKFKVPYDDLIAANHIEDPRKLKIGQKLVIPAKTAKAKKG